VAVLFAPVIEEVNVEAAMNFSPASSSPLAQLIVPADQPLPPARRLIVLIPDQDTDEAELTRRIWALASPRPLAVMYLSLTRDSLTEARARRRLATLAALTRDDRVAVQTQLEIGSQWMPAVKAVWRSGDLVVCHAEQKAPSGFGDLWRKPLAQTLAAALQAPVYLFSGFYPKRPLPKASGAAQVLSWSIPLALLVGFFLLQVQIIQQVTGWLQTALLSASVALEFGLLGLWNLLSL
jgi:hypothetical protein